MRVTGHVLLSGTQFPGNFLFRYPLIAMSNQISNLFRKGFAVLFCSGALFSAGFAQQNQPKPQEPADEVIRINTELVQTDVMVFDKDGHFVDGLKPEQFQLSVDGHPQSISFFERVAAGSAREDAQLAAARGKAATPDKAAAVSPPERGRVILFLVDDLHMSPESLNHTRKTLTRFIEREMGQSDQVAITSANGQVGFLQQLTNNKTVLLRAVEKLKSSLQSHGDADFPPMSETQAIGVLVRNDTELLNFFMEPLIRNGVTPRVAETTVKQRAKQILDYSYRFTRGTLDSLGNLTRTSGQMPGRKLVFFLSDGFLLNLLEPDMMTRLRNITNAAARNGVNIYTLDARGLTSDLDNPNSAQGFDPKGRSVRASDSEISASQEPLQTIASNTGGRALLNSNTLNSGLVKALQETSVYYLLAWRPPGEEPKGNKFRKIEVKVVGRPELSVYVRRGYYDVEAKSPSKKDKPKEEVTAAVATKTADTELRDVLQAAYPKQDLPAQLSLVYMDTPDKGITLTASVQVAKQFITFNPGQGKQSAVVDLTGIVLDEQGASVGRFNDSLTVDIPSEPNAALRQDLIYNYQTALKPGLYQVRVAARDNKSALMGSAMQWIEIPDLASHRLSMSSLLLGETTKEAETQKGDAAAVAEVAWNVNHRFARTSSMRFLTYVYNAARGTDGVAPPDIALQVQILRNNQPIMTTAQRKVDFSGQTDIARLAYAAELPLEGMKPGQYVLQVTVIDRIAKTSASQRTSFEIE